MTTGIPNFSPLTQPWRELGEIYRRICALRSQGRETDARAVEEGDFAAALAAMREQSGAEPENEERLQAVLAAEEDRVVNATALAELLVPLLAERFGLRPAAPVAPSLIPRAAKGMAPAAVPSVADFIDDMLAQDRARRPQLS